MDDSYVIFLHHSSDKDENLKQKIVKLTTKANSVSVFYCNRIESYLIKNGKEIKEA